MTRQERWRERQRAAKFGTCDNDEAESCGFTVTNEMGCPHWRAKEARQ